MYIHTDFRYTPTDTRVLKPIVKAFAGQPTYIALVMQSIKGGQSAYQSRDHILEIMKEVST
jgi:hypothetical protein